MVSVNTNAKTLNGLVQGSFDSANVGTLSSTSLSVSGNVSSASLNTGNFTSSTMTSSGNLNVGGNAYVGSLTSSGTITAANSKLGSVVVNLLTASGIVNVYSLISGPIVCSSLTSSGAVNVASVTSPSVGCVSLTTSGFINYGNSQVNGSLTSSGAVTSNLNVSNTSDQTYLISFPVFTGSNTANWSCYASSANPSGTAYYSASYNYNSWNSNSFSADSSGNYHGSATTTDNVGAWTGDYLTFNLSNDSFVLTALTTYIWNNTTQMVITVSPDNSNWTNLGVFNIPYVTDNNYISLSFPNNSTICNYVRLIFTKANGSPNIVSQTRLTCRGIASRMNSAGNLYCRSANITGNTAITGTLTSSGAISTSSSVTATGNINTTGGNLLINSSPVLNSTTLGSQIVNSGLQNTSNSSFQIGSLYSLMSRFSNIKIDFGYYNGGTATGTQNFNITFPNSVYVYALINSNNTSNAYVVTVYNVGTTSFSYSKKYIGSSGGASNSISEGFYWLAIGS